VIEKSTFHTVEGKTISEYLNNFKLNTNISGNYKVFSGSLSANFETTQYKKATNSFATVQSLINKYLLQIKKEYNADDLKKYLTEKFIADINDQSLSSSDIFATYGTHCMRSIIVGGRLDFNISANESKVSSSTTIGAHARAAFKTMFSKVSLEINMVNEKEQKEFESHMEKKLEVYGGASQYGQMIINEGNYDEWIESIKNNYVFCEYGDDAFIPVWELCNNETRKKQLETDFKTWAVNREYKDNTEKIEITFAFADTTSWTNIRGDAHPAAHNNDNIVESSVALRVNKDKNIDLILYYSQEELGGDKTAFKNVATIKNIYKGSNYNIIDIVGDTTCYSSELVTKNYYSWNKFKSTCSFVENFQYKADDNKTDNLKGKVGIKGTVRFEAFVEPKLSAGKK
jgi:hypothetical protein